MGALHAAKKIATRTGCDCIEKANETLAPRNVELDLILRVRDGRQLVKIATSKINSRIRDKGPLVAAAYCPFCGEKYLP
jgi:hypothetical protein